MIFLGDSFPQKKRIASFRRLFLLLSFFLLPSFLGLAQDSSKKTDQKNLSSEQRQNLLKVEGLFRQAYGFLNSGEYTSAIELFRSAVSMYPQHKQANYWLGLALEKAGFFREAIEAFLEVDPDSTYFFFAQNRVKYLERILFQSHIVPYQKREVKENPKYVFMNYIQTDMSPSQIEVDEKDNLYIADYRKGQVEFLDSTLNKKKTILSIPKPTDIAMTEDLLLVSSFQEDTVAVYDRKNFRKVFSIGYFGTGEGALAGPTGLQIYEGNLYVVDQGNGRIQVYHMYQNGKFFRSIGEKGEQLGQLKIPTDLAIFDQGIWVTDTGNQRIQVFDLSGNVKAAYTLPKGRYPKKVFVRDSNLYVLDALEGLFIWNKQQEEFQLYHKPEEDFQFIDTVAMSSLGTFFYANMSDSHIVSYIREEKRLSALEVRVEELNLGENQKVIIQLQAKDYEGKSLYGLDKRNFEIMDNGQYLPLEQVSVFSVKDMPKKLGIVLYPNQRMKEQFPKIKQYFSLLYDKMQLYPNIELEIFVLDKEMQKISLPSYSKSSFLSMLDQILEKEPNPESYTTGLYNILYRYTKEYRHRGHLLLLEPSLDEIDGKYYNIEQIGQYAYQGGASLYSLIDSHALESDYLHFQYLAGITDAKMISFDNIAELDILLDEINEKEHLLYQLEYLLPLQRAEAGKGLWRSIQVFLNYQGLSGNDIYGYYDYLEQ